MNFKQSIRYVLRPTTSFFSISSLVTGFEYKCTYKNFSLTSILYTTLYFSLLTYIENVVLTDCLVHSYFAILNLNFFKFKYTSRMDLFFSIIFDQIQI